MLPDMPDRVRVFHSATNNTSPEPWNRAVQPELRAAITTLSSDEALTVNAMGRYEGIATHRGRVEYDEAVVQGAMLQNTMTDRVFLVLGVHESGKHNAQGDPDHLICALQATRPALELV